MRLDWLDNLWTARNLALACPAHELAISERGCVVLDQPQRVGIGENAAAGAPTPAHSRAPFKGTRRAQSSGNSLLGERKQVREA
jgi:hypothetical protein